MSFEKSGRAASEQFTISRASLPGLLVWTERLQERFRVKIDIQWELEGIVQQDTPQVRWVYLYGKNFEDCHAAKTYIITLCDPLHKLNVTYPEDIDDTLKSSQAMLEVKYSVVIQFTKIGQLLIKSQDQVNMMLVLSFIENCATELEKNSLLDSLRKLPRPSASSLRGRHNEESLSHGDDLETDSILSITNEAPSAGDESMLVDSKHELKRAPRSGKTGNTLFPAEDFPYLSSAISPDRKMMKSSLHSDELSPNSNPLGNLCTAYDLSARQKLIVQRILQNGEFTKAEVERTLEKVGNNWKCLDFTELIRAERENRKVPQTSSRNDLPSGSPSSNLLDSLTTKYDLSPRQYFVIRSILLRGEFTKAEVESTLERVGNNWRSLDFTEAICAERENRKVSQTSRKMMKTSLHSDELSPNSNPLGNLCTAYDLSARQKLIVQRMLQNGEYTKAEVERTLEKVGNNWKCFDFTELIRAERENRKVSQTSRNDLPSGDSLVDLKDTQRRTMQSLETPSRSPLGSTTAEFAEFSPKRFSSPLTSRLRKDYISICDETVSESEDPITISSQSENDCIVLTSSDESDTPETFYVQPPPSRDKSAPYEKKLHGVIEGLRLQMKELQDRLEKDKEEQQQQFQEKLLEQEKKLKAEQGAQIKKQIQEQQLKKKETPPVVPLNRSLSEDITIAPAKRNKDSPFRPVVIDGSNVAMCHGRDRFFSCRGIAICVQYFQHLGHQDIMVFVPLGRHTQDPRSRDRPIRDQPILEMLKKQGLLSFTPSRRIGHTYVNCYDDRFIVDLAVQNDGVIVSNDNYRDLMRESSRWKFVIENRLVMFTFAGDRFMIPDDPLGRNGPRISQLLRKTPKSKETSSTTHRVSQAAPGKQPLKPALAPARALGHSNHRLVQGSDGYQLMPLLAMGQRIVQTVPVAPPQLAMGQGIVPIVPVGPPRSPMGQGVVPIVPLGSPRLAPVAAPHWGAGSTTAAAHLFPQGSSVVHPAKEQPKKTLTTNQQLVDPSHSKAASFDPRLSPSFKTLQTVFPDNEAEVLKVLTSFRDVTELNDLSLLVLAEIRDGAAKT